MPQRRSSPLRSPMPFLGAAAWALLASNALSQDAPAPIPEPNTRLTPYTGWSVGQTPTSTPAELEAIYTPLDGTLDIPAIERPFDFLLQRGRDLEEATGLRLAAAYTMLFQQASGGPGSRYAGAGDLDLIGDWTLLGRGTRDTGRLVFSAEYRHSIGNQPPSALAGQIGALAGTTGGFNDRGWVVRDFYWMQRLFDDRLRFAIGRGDSSDFVGGHRMHSLNVAFSNRNYSGNLTIPFPGHGETAGVSIRPSDLWFVTLGASNAYGQTSTNEFSTLTDEWKFFSFAEAGITPTFKNLGLGRYRVLLWHMDERDLDNLPSDQGFALIADQDLSERLLAFARFEYSEESITNVMMAIDAGVGIRGLFGSPDNMTGIGGAVARPRRGGGRDEKVIEVFHRWQVTDLSQFSLGVQGIFDPSNAPDKDAIAVFSARFRVVF